MIKLKRINTIIFQISAKNKIGRARRTTNQNDPDERFFYSKAQVFGKTTIFFYTFIWGQKRFMVNTQLAHNVI